MYISTLVNIILITVLLAYLIWWAVKFSYADARFNNTVDATITKIICNTVCGRECNKSNIGSSKSCGVFCDVESYREDVDIYMCEMTVRYTIGNITYNRNLVVIGHTLYFLNQIISIQYDADNPFDIRITQQTYDDIGEDILIFSIITLTVVWLIFIAVFVWKQVL